MRRFGSGVTIIERNARLAHREDQDVSDMLHDMCREEGIEVVTGARITGVEGKSDEWVKLYAVRDKSEMNLEGSHILVASGLPPGTYYVTALLKTGTTPYYRASCPAAVRSLSPAELVRTRPP